MSDFAGEVLRAQQVRADIEDSLRAQREKLLEKVQEFERLLVEAASVLKAKGVPARTVATQTGGSHNVFTLTEAQAWDLGEYALTEDGRLFTFISGRWPHTHVVLHEKMEVPADIHRLGGPYAINTQSLPDGSQVEVLMLDGIFGDHRRPARDWLVAAVAKVLP
jgi:hypothetical protein